MNQLAASTRQLNKCRLSYFSLLFYYFLPACLYFHCRETDTECVWMTRPVARLNCCCANIPTYTKRTVYKPVTLYPACFFLFFFWLLSRHVDVFFSLSLLYSVHAGLVTFGLYHTIKKKVLRPDSVSFRSLSAVHRLILTVFLQRKFFLFFFLFSHSSHRQMNGLFCCVYKCTYNGRKAILFKCPHTPTFSRSPYTKCNSCPCPHY